MKHRDSNARRVTLRLHPHVMARVKAEAMKREKTVNQLLNELIRDALRKSA